MNQPTRKTLIIIFLIASCLVFPFKAWSASLYISGPEEKIYQGDTFIVNLIISSPTQAINVSEGTISFDADLLMVKTVSTGGSIFSIWPSPPTFSNKNGLLSFSGGTSSSFIGQNGEVLKIVFLAKEPGPATIKPESYSQVLLADGNGTKAELSVTPLVLNISAKPSERPAADSWQNFTAEDKTPPANFPINLSQDPSVFNGQYFISFFTTDNESGIDYFEVKEGQNDFVRAESPYVLQDQSLGGEVLVRVFDSAGNQTTERLVLPQKKMLSNGWLMAIFSSLVILFLYIISNVVKRK
ncbi:MAG: hypothetical protein KAZ30_00725 [Candidatus Magasanikbacteria bacterium]|nr:hypothetical protein [Candidatus Magasanikbacteria bacterium]